MNNMKIIGRKKEQTLLANLIQSKRAEFLAVYGRRRVGKTYLIEQFFKRVAGLYFSMTGVHKGTLKQHLTIFSKIFSATFFADIGLQMEPPKNWMQAFELLTNAINKFDQSGKIVLFFDELPWLASKKSDFKQALDYFWNTTWSKNNRIILIICGSAASWIIKNIINDQGGLHNRVTQQLPMYPFSLKETEDYLAYLGNHFNQRQVLELYMCLGGIPHYLEKIKKNLSASQNIASLCFSRNGQLFDEFDKLFSSLFDQADAYIELVKIIASKRNGIARSELQKKAKRSITGGTLTQRMIALEQAGFIKSFLPIGYIEKGIFYKLIDEYCYFYLTWISSIKKHIEEDSHYWEAKHNTGEWYSWAGYTFESICIKHISQIKKALYIPAGSVFGAWNQVANKSLKTAGAQIDLLFDRDDGVVTLCEIKYTQSAFEIDKKYATELQRKMNIYQFNTKTNKQLFLAMVTIDPLVTNQYSEELVTGKATIQDLFQD